MHFWDAQSLLFKTPDSDSGTKILGLRGPDATQVVRLKLLAITPFLTEY